MPQVGWHELRIITPQLLELYLVTTKEPAPAPVRHWDFIDSKNQLQLPPAGDFEVLVDGKPMGVKKIGFKRRPLYAPLRKRDLRISASLFLELERRVQVGQLVEVKARPEKGWFSGMTFKNRSEPLRENPALHVNHLGYAPTAPKAAMIGYYLGNLGEMMLPEKQAFQILELGSETKFFEGELRRRLDKGFDFETYQQVWEANFTEFSRGGEYRLFIPDLGTSFPFRIDEGIPAALARTYALGIYHQRCGTSNSFPFTRFTHEACHTRPAEIPTADFKNVLEHLGRMAWDATNQVRHTAPVLRDFKNARYPFVRQGKIDVLGGHHDAGDYSKYTINSAAFIHCLIFACDAFPGVAGLDNLGLPESGDGKSDLLQEAKWEADFLAKLQDEDGGFYFLVYPRDRQYEDNVLPDAGDPQVVFPKTTAATAAAIAALAQTASSPAFKKQFPGAAQNYLASAKKGWRFLEQALQKFGSDGAYQKITHYGNEFLHDDELIWAAVELFLATGDPTYEKFFLQKFDPANRETRRWTWWRLYEAYGCAIRSYAFGGRTGRVLAGQLDVSFLKKCEDEVIAAADDQARFAEESAYGTSFPDPTKRFRSAGWYFSSDRAFDLAVASALEFPALNSPKKRYLAALWGNLNYESGCNPINMPYLTGIGWRRQREIVHQYALNDERTLPPSGLPIANIQGGFAYLDNYKKELGELIFPTDWNKENPYPFYDRWGDSFNTTTEFVVVNQARALAAAAFLMGQSSLKNQSWRPTANLSIEFSRTGSKPSLVQARLTIPKNFDPLATVIWEMDGAEPALLRAGQAYSLTPLTRPAWIEVEVMAIDGRRLFGRTNCATLNFQNLPLGR